MVEDNWAKWGNSYSYFKLPCKYSGYFLHENIISGQCPGNNSTNAVAYKTHFIMFMNSVDWEFIRTEWERLVATPWCLRIHLSWLLAGFHSQRKPSGRVRCVKLEPERSACRDAESRVGVLGHQQGRPQDFHQSWYRDSSWALGFRRRMYPLSWSVGSVGAEAVSFSSLCYWHLKWTWTKGTPQNDGWQNKVKNASMSSVQTPHPRNPTEFLTVYFFTTLDTSKFVHIPLSFLCDDVRL